MPEFVAEFTPPIEPDLPALSLYRGLTDPQVDQLIQITQVDEAVRYFDSDDNRFGNREMYEQWLAKRRTIYALADIEGNLFGVYWIGEKPLPDRNDYIENLDHSRYPYTMATRLYGAAKGHHLSTRFVLTATADFVQSHGLPQTGFWAEVSAVNGKSVHKNLAAGYRIVTAKPDERGKIIMVQDYLPNNL